MRGSYHDVYCTVSWEDEMWDMAVTVEVTSYSPAYRGDFYEPPHGASYEYEIVEIAHDLPKNAAWEPVPQGLREAVENWIESTDGHNKICQQIEDDESYIEDEC